MVLDHLARGHLKVNGTSGVRISIISEGEIVFIRLIRLVAAPFLFL
jgi:hypothetical protein